MKLSNNFTLEELVKSNTAIVHKINNKPDEIQINNLSRLCNEILQPIRDKYGKPINISSGFRCQTLNKLVGGVPSSQHQYGMAADIDNGDKENKKLFDLIVHLIKSNVIDVGQLLWEHNGNWIHISLPDGKHINQILNIN